MNDLTKNKKILITGATGFIGREIVREISKKENFEIYLAISLKSTTTKNDFPANVKEVFKIDIGEKTSVEELLKIGEIDIVIHAAGLAHQFGKTRKEDFWLTNVLGTENICDLAVNLSVKHFLLLSSVAVYGNYGNQEVYEDFECRPVGDYAKSKFEGEQKAKHICFDNQIKLTILRLGTVIGENDRGNTARLITAIDKNRFIWIGKGKNKKSLIYKNDIAKIILQIIEKKSFGGGIFNLTADSISMLEIVETITRTLRKKTLKLNLPEQIFIKPLAISQIINFSFLQKIESTLNKWLSNEIYAGQKLFKEYNIKPQTDIIKALEKQVSAYQETKNK